MAKIQTAHEVETLEALQSIARALGDIECDSRPTVSFEIDTHNMFSWMGEQLFEIAETLKKIEQKMK